MATPQSMVIPMAVSTRVFRAANDSARSGKHSTSLPLRDWRRAFALVDAIKSEYREAPWFRGIRAFRDPGDDSIRIEVEASGGSLPTSLPERLLALGVRLRLVASGAPLAAAAL